MPTTVLDRDKAVELLRKYRPSLTHGKAGGGVPTVLFLCPFHNDSNPSFTFNLHSFRGQCFSCKACADVVELITEFEHTTPEEATKIVAPYLRKVVQPESARKVKVIDVSMTQLQEWNNALATDVKLQILMKKWGWTNELAQRYLIGASDGRFTIPLIEGEDIIGLKYYAPGTQGVKYQNHVGSQQCCWPLDNLKEDRVFLVEGEKDCLTMNAAGFNAVTFSAGAGSVPGSYIRFFAGKEVYIIYDIDEAGRKGAVTAANILHFAARKIYIVDLPLDGIPKGDLTDAFMMDPENFKDFIDTLVKGTTEHVPPAANSRVNIPPEVFRTYLEEIVPKKLFYRRVNMKVRVISNAHNETTIVPKDIEITCNRDYKDHVCQACPAYYKPDGLHLHVKPEYPELLSMVGNNTKVQRCAIANMTGVPESCTKFRIEQKNHQAIYPIVMIPAIEANKKQHNYTMVEAWALDIPAQENEDYDAEGVVLAKPDTQRQDIVCYRMTKDMESIDSFELNEDMINRLGVFRCADHHSMKSAAS